MKKWHATSALLICLTGLVGCNQDTTTANPPQPKRNSSEDHVRKMHKEEQDTSTNDREEAELHISKKIDQLVDKAIRRIQDATDRAITNIENATDRSIRDIDSAGDRANKRIRPAQDT